MSKIVSADDTTNANAEELGALIFQSALAEYLGEVDEAEAEAFESFVNENQTADDFLERLLSKYPMFEQILQAEVVALKKEIATIVEEGS